jgi:predicted O-methyltransferase YrrM
MLKKLLKPLAQIIVPIGFPFTFLAALWLKLVMKVKPGYLDEKIFMLTGILPVADHYYQPLINPKKHLLKSLRDDRPLPGIDFNIEEQLALLAKFNYNDELIKLPLEEKEKFEFYYNNGFYESGDAEYLYSIVRHLKPGKIIEIGSGYSTLITQKALLQNKIEDDTYQYKHVCIEPYEQPWLDKKVEVVRKRVETIDKSFFEQLEANDILFIDSTHVIKPQGDVLFEYLEILPILKPGVIIHIHDIFMPKDYPDSWIIDEHRLWNEQYLLEAFLTFNNKFKIIGSLNYLTHKYREQFAAKNPVFNSQPGREIAGFWMVKTA